MKRLFSFVWVWRGWLAVILVPVIVAIASGSGIWWLRLPGRLLGQAELRLSQGRTLEAVASLETYVKRRPQDSKTVLLLARCLVEIGGASPNEKALKYLGAVPESDPLAGEARWRAGNIALLGLHRAAVAERCYRKSVELDSDSVEAREGLLRIHWWQGRKSSEVFRWLEEIWQLGDLSQRRRALELLFWVRYGSFPLDLALPVMEGFLSADGSDYGARLGMARCMIMLKRYDEALTLCAGCVQEQPNDPLPRAILVDHALVQGDWKTARSMLEDWPEQAWDLNYWSSRGEYLQQAEGRFAEAIDCFKRVLEDRPDRWAARYRLSQCLEALGQHERAERERALSDRIGKALLDTRVQRFLDEVLPNVDSRPQGCYEIADFFLEVGLEKDSQKWQKLGQELEAQAARVKPTTEGQSDAASGMLGSLR